MGDSSSESLIIVIFFLLKWVLLVAGGLLIGLTSKFPETSIEEYNFFLSIRFGSDTTAFFISKGLLKEGRGSSD